MRAVFCRQVAISSGVVDFVLLFFHPADVSFQRDILFVAIVAGRSETQQFSGTFFIAVICMFHNRTGNNVTENGNTETWIPANLR